MRYIGKNDPQESTYEQTKEVVSCHVARRGSVNVFRFNGMSALAYLLHDALDLQEILLEEGIVRCSEVGADSRARGEFCIT